ncbi:MAG TPA: guanylate kinase [Firmicutes bacterium]|mgnify:FL=1|nr:guanylate kinase [Bacillota bacterium]
MSDRGMLIILSGPSGSGKGTIIKRLLQERADTVLSISATTRAPRPGELNNVHYFFRTREEFEELIRTGALLEYAEYNGNYYGTPEDPIRKWLEQGKNVILEIEVQGAEKVMDYRSDLVSVFITIPSMTELERRLRSRGTETEDKIQGRLAVARRELARAFRYDYVVLNDEVELAVERIHTIINAEKMRYSRMEKTVLEVLENA